MPGQMPWEMDWSAQAQRGPARAGAGPPPGAKPWEHDWGAAAPPPRTAFQGDDTAPPAGSGTLTAAQRVGQATTAAARGSTGTQGPSPRAEALQRVIRGPAGGETKRETFDQQQAIETELRGQGLSDEQIQADPRWQSAARGFSQATSAESTEMAAGNVLGPAIGAAAGKVLGPVVRGARGVIDRATGRSARQGAESLRGEALEQAGSTAARQEGAAAEQAAVAERAAGARQQIADQQPAVAAARAQQNAPVIPMEAERAQTLASLRQRTHALEQEYRRTGFGADEAKRMVAQAERQVQDTEAAVGALEQRLLAQPGMTADEFGQQVRTATKGLYDKYSGLRKSQSGFNDALESAGDKLRVNTAGVASKIDGYLKDVKSPELRAALTEIKGLIQTDGHNALSVRQADNLRKHLSDIPGNVHEIGEIKKALVESATTAYKPYREALAKWRVLSRPLDIVERKGALSKVLSTDPISMDYALAEAQVVGRVIAGARAGHPTLTRLLEESPELRDAARLHFTQDLFGKEAVPSVASLRTWLRTNERPLRQLNLLDEFRDIRSAREAATRAVQEAKGARSVAARRQDIAEDTRRAAGSDLQGAERLREKMKGRIAEGEQAAEREGAERAGLTTRRAGEASKRLGATEQTARGEQQKALKAADHYRQTQTQIRTADPKEVPRVARSFVDGMRKDGHINDRQYEEAIRQIQAVERTMGESTAAKKKIGKIIGWIAAGAVGAETARGGRDLIAR